MGCRDFQRVMFRAKYRLRNLQAFDENRVFPIIPSVKSPGHCNTSSKTSSYFFAMRTGSLRVAHSS